MARAMLTTIDNPYNPFDDYDSWYAFDDRMGYHTPSVLARTVLTSDELSEADQDFRIELAIDEIIKEDSLDRYRKVTREEVGSD